MVWPMSSPKSDMRLYIDLLFRKTNMYANYNPTTLLELGDYGDITKEGEFIRSGNILQEDTSLRDAVESGKEPTGSDKYYFASRSPRNNTFSVITTDIPTLAECSPKVGWDIKKDRHAALIMINANRHEIRFEGRLHRYIQNLPELAEKAVVTKVYRCSAYAQLITNDGQSGQVYAGFKGNNSAPSTPNSSGTSVVERAWQTFSQTGNWNTGTHPLSSSLYTPLVTIRQIRPKGPTTGYRDPIPPEITDEDEMQDYILPWGDLDEHGDEID